MTSAECFRERVQGAGMRFVALPACTEIEQRYNDDLASSWALPGSRSPESGVEFRRLMAGMMPVQYAHLQALLKDFPADLILHDTMFAGTLPLLHGVGPRPLVVALGATCLPLAPEHGTPMFDTSIAGSLMRMPDIYLQPAVPGFEYPVRPRPRNLRFIGALLGGVDAPVPLDLPLGVAKKKRIVLITQGCHANREFSQLVQPAIAALAHDRDVLMLVTTGGRPLSAVAGKLPPNVCLSHFLPFAHVMPEIDLLITNGGYETVTHALSCGVLVIAAGVADDKAGVAARVAWSGAGIDLRTGTPEALRIRQAVDEIFGNPAYRQHAQRLADEFAGYDAVADLPALLMQAVLAHRRSGCAAMESAVAA
jgi:hypothetical protein